MSATTTSHARALALIVEAERVRRLSLLAGDDDEAREAQAISRRAAVWLMLAPGAS